MCGCVGVSACARVAHFLLKQNVATKVPKDGYRHSTCEVMQNWQYLAMIIFYSRQFNATKAKAHLGWSQTHFLICEKKKKTTWKCICNKGHSITSIARGCYMEEPWSSLFLISPGCEASTAVSKTRNWTFCSADKYYIFGLWNHYCHCLPFWSRLL